jgi:hypothetical protein
MFEQTFKNIGERYRQKALSSELIQETVKTKKEEVAA